VIYHEGELWCPGCISIANGTSDVVVSDKESGDKRNEGSGPEAPTEPVYFINIKEGKGPSRVLLPRWHSRSCAVDVFIVMIHATLTHGFDPSLLSNDLRVMASATTTDDTYCQDVFVQLTRKLQWWEDLSHRKENLGILHPPGHNNNIAALLRAVWALGPDEVLVTTKIKVKCKLPGLIPESLHDISRTVRKPYWEVCVGSLRNSADSDYTEPFENLRSCAHYLDEASEGATVNGTCTEPKGQECCGHETDVTSAYSLPPVLWVVVDKEPEQGVLDGVDSTEGWWNDHQWNEESRVEHLVNTLDEQEEVRKVTGTSALDEDLEDVGAWCFSVDVAWRDYILIGVIYKSRGHYSAEFLSATESQWYSHDGMVSAYPQPVEKPGFWDTGMGKRSIRNIEALLYIRRLQVPAVALVAGEESDPEGTGVLEGNQAVTAERDSYPNIGTDSVELGCAPHETMATGTDGWEAGTAEYAAADCLLLQVLPSAVLDELPISEDLEATRFLLEACAVLADLATRRDILVTTAEDSWREVENLARRALQCSNSGIIYAVGESIMNMCSWEASPLTSLALFVLDLLIACVRHEDEGRVEVNNLVEMLLTVTEGTGYSIHVRSELAGWLSEGPVGTGEAMGADRNLDISDSVDPICVSDEASPMDGYECFGCEACMRNGGSRAECNRGLLQQGGAVGYETVAKAKDGTIIFGGITKDYSRTLFMDLANDLRKLGLGARVVCKAMGHWAKRLHPYEFFRTFLLLAMKELDPRGDGLSMDADSCDDILARAHGPCWESRGPVIPLNKGGISWGSLELTGAAVDWDARQVGSDINMTTMSSNTSWWNEFAHCEGIDLPIVDEEWRVGLCSRLTGAVLGGAKDPGCISWHKELRELPRVVQDLTCSMGLTTSTSAVHITTRYTGGVRIKWGHAAAFRWGRRTTLYVWHRATLESLWLWNKVGSGWHKRVGISTRAELMGGDDDQTHCGVAIFSYTSEVAEQSSNPWLSETRTESIVPPVIWHGEIITDELLGPRSGQPKLTDPPPFDPPEIDAAPLSRMIGHPLQYTPICDFESHLAVTSSRQNMEGGHFRPDKKGLKVPWRRIVLFGAVVIPSITDLLVNIIGSVPALWAPPGCRVFLSSKQEEWNVALGVMATTKANWEPLQHLFAPAQQVLVGYMLKEFLDTGKILRTYGCLEGDWIEAWCRGAGAMFVNVERMRYYLKVMRDAFQDWKHRRGSVRRWEEMLYDAVIRLIRRYPEVRPMFLSEYDVLDVHNPVVESLKEMVTEWAFLHPNRWADFGVDNIVFRFPLQTAEGGRQPRLLHLRFLEEWPVPVEEVVTPTCPVCGKSITANWKEHESKCNAAVATQLRLAEEALSRKTKKKGAPSPSKVKSAAGCSTAVPPPVKTPKKHKEPKEPKGALYVQCPWCLKQKTSKGYWESGHEYACHVKQCGAMIARSMVDLMQCGICSLLRKRGDMTSHHYSNECELFYRNKQEQLGRRDGLLCLQLEEERRRALLVADLWDAGARMWTTTSGAPGIASRLYLQLTASGARVEEGPAPVRPVEERKCYVCGGGRPYEALPGSLVVGKNCEGPGRSGGHSYDDTSGVQLYTAVDDNCSNNTASVRSVPKKLAPGWWCMPKHMIRSERREICFQEKYARIQVDSLEIEAFKVLRVVEIPCPLCSTLGRMCNFIKHLGSRSCSIHVLGLPWAERETHLWHWAIRAKGKRLMIQEEYVRAQLPSGEVSERKSMMQVPLKCQVCKRPNVPSYMMGLHMAGYSCRRAAEGIATAVAAVAEGGVQIFIADPGNPTIVLLVDLDGGIYAVKQQLLTALGIPADEMCLVYQGVELSDDRSLRAIGITRDSTLQYHLRTKGGAPIKQGITEECIEDFSAAPFSPSALPRFRTSQGGELYEGREVMFRVYSRVSRMCGDGGALPVRPASGRLPRCVPTNMPVALSFEQSPRESPRGNSLVISPWRDEQETQIFVVTLQGRTLSLAVDLGREVLLLKQHLYEFLGIPTDCQRLLFQGVQLE